MRNDLPIRDMLGNASKFLGDVTKKADAYEPSIKNYDGIR